MPALNSIHKKLLFLTIVIALSLISAWVFIKYLPTQKEMAPLPISTSTPQSSMVSAPTFTAPTNISRETKTYRNEEWGFEFQYPENWSFHENTFYSPFSKFNLVGAPPGKDYQLDPPMLVNIVTPDFADRAVIGRKNLGATASDVVVAGIEGEKYEYIEELLRISVDLPFGEYRMILGTQKQYEDIFNQILSSFKFLK